MFFFFLEIAVHTKDSVRITRYFGWKTHSLMFWVPHGQNIKNNGFDPKVRPLCILCKTAIL